MVMDIANDGETILDWNEDRVHQWFTALGFPQYEHQIREHNISGDVLCMLDPETLKAVGVATVGQRLAILKAIYLAKVAYHIPIDWDHYVPPSEAQERVVSVEKLNDLIKEQAQRVSYLEEDNRRLKETVDILLEEFSQVRNSQRSDEPTLKRQPSFKWAQYPNPAKSPTKPELESPNPSPHQTEHDISQVRSTQPNPIQSASSASQRNPAPSMTESPGPQPSSSAKTNRQESSDNLKSFKVSLEDPTWKVLPAALKKYKINNDNWQNYAMFICYGSAGNRIERCLSYDEKPLLLFQKLKDAKKNPVFMLKHIKDIRSPIAVAQQKHALRKASISSEHTGSNSTTPSVTPSHPNKPIGVGQGKAIARPPRLEVSDLSTPLTGTIPQAGWPEVMSPVAENKSGEDGSSREIVSATSVNSGQNCDSTKSRSTTLYGSVEAESTKREIPPSMGVSYAVAIYPYMAEQEDEFDVVVGDTFVILSRARGWWVVQRDPTGSGVVDTDTSKQGWVPAGCLLETNVPVASAIAEATAAAKASGSPDVSENKTPILPLSIISTSFPGVALMDYKKKGDEELDLAKDDALRVFKRYNHWSYAVKEEGGDRGWVPSWFIGKVPTPGGAPTTPSTSTAPAMSNGPSLDADVPTQYQVSPMSSAFPGPMQSRGLA
ncbi:hypothetical protein J3R82DRAFT_2373 [Butyriboletus roseoflavus]|nr:hypothetical protein J3R82DRAFT_2373 [Butyriboletus roseoflavus]